MSTAHYVSIACLILLLFPFFLAAVEKKERLPNAVGALLFEIVLVAGTLGLWWFSDLDGHPWWFRLGWYATAAAAAVAWLSAAFIAALFGGGALWSIVQTMVGRSRGDAEPSLEQWRSDQRRLWAGVAVVALSLLVLVAPGSALELARTAAGFVLFVAVVWFLGQAWSLVRNRKRD